MENNEPKDSSGIYKQTTELRWSKEVYYDGALGCNVRILQQKWIEVSTGEEMWQSIETEQ